MRAARVTGSVVLVERQSGPVFFLKARRVDGRQVKKRLGPAHIKRGRAPDGVWTRKEAEDRLREWLVQLGAEHGPTRSLTFSDAVVNWIEWIEHDLQRRPSTVRGYRNHVNNHLLPQFATRPLIDITVREIDQWRATLVSRLAPSTINQLLVLLHGIFRRAQFVYDLPNNPAAGVRRQPHTPHGDIDVLSPGDVLALAGTAENPQDAAFFLVAGFTGLRLGELLALRWRDVDFSKRILHVRWSYVNGHEDRPKSHKVRAVPLMDHAARALADLSQRADFTATDDLVFVNEVGRHVNHDRLRRRYKSALAVAMLPPLRLHDLRHTFGTIAVQAFPLSDVKAYMGHANIDTTMVYVHHRPQHDAAERLTALVEADSPPRPRSLDDTHTTEYSPREPTGAT